MAEAASSPASTALRARLDAASHPLELVLMRHGETSSSVASTYASHTDVAITPRGRGQAGAVAGWLAAHDLVPDLIAHSPLSRAKESAEIVSRELEAARLGPRIPVVCDDRLRELDFGEFEGRSAAELAERSEFRAWRSFRGAPTIPAGTESFAAAADRLSAFLADTAAGRRRVLVVAHGHLLRSWTALDALGMGNPNLLELDAGALAVVRLGAGYSRLKLWNLSP